MTIKPLFGQEQASLLASMKLPRVGQTQGMPLLGWIGSALLLSVLAMAVLAPLLAGSEPQKIVGLPYEIPSLKHFLGTDDIGRDIFAQFLYGARISLTIGLLSALFSVGLGLGVALLAGYFRGIIDVILMRVVDITLAFPFLPLVIVLTAFLGRGLTVTVLVIAAVIWARPARLLRAQVLKVREFQHVTAAQAMGAAPPYILVRHVLPRIAPLAVAQFVRAANIAVFIEASLAFLGLGDPNWNSWGAMLFFANSRNAFLTNSWLWWILPTGLGLTITLVGLAFLGYAVEEWADPRLAARSWGGTLKTRPKVQTAETPLPPSPTITSSTPGVLEIHGLKVWYDTPAGPIRAVDDVTFTIPLKRIVGLVGESGCGKSTLSTAILQLTRRPGRQMGGTIYLNGREFGPENAARLRGREIALIPQNAMNALNPTYTVHYQVMEAAALIRDRASAAAWAHELLELVGIPAARHRAYPHELSGGMRQRVVIAMAISNKPSLLIADEPVTGLDVITQARVLQLLLKLREQFGMAMLLISHDLPLIGRVADDLVVMYAGRIVESGTAKQVMNTPNHPYTQALLHAFPSARGPRQAITAIAGDPPDLLNLPQGCRFRPRCQLAFEECAHIDPPFLERATGHGAACLLGESSRA